MFTLNCKGRLLVVDKPLVMGIINITPDSFYKESRFSEKDAILSQAAKMIREGATILDIGGQSSRPGSAVISPEEEIRRIIPAIEAVRENFPSIFISADTFYSNVAMAAVTVGTDIINDISAGSMDEKMIDTVSSLGVPYILMHMQGTPQTMQENPRYENITREVLDFFINKIEELKQKNIQDVIIDPGFGFGKTIEHNFELLRNLSVFRMLDKPMLLGISRKSMISKTLGTIADDALNGTTVLNTIGLTHGASILRVHDVKEAKETVALFCRYKK